ncbi:MAG: hypothetical protein PsegKO_33090 [Pseudohongiellaceae bacterium]
MISLLSPLIGSLMPRLKGIGLWLAIIGVLVLIALLANLRLRLATTRLTHALESLTRLEAKNAQLRRMLEATRHRPRSRSELVDRLRDGEF